uniref:Protein MAIN-LIKE 2-like n=1 Tax=Cicer arietinum TaxID=3827 RepID=A0A1S2YN77_CICAR|nr:protein MAIN-LIKE 2-like [Cicer arietinum]
MASDSSSLLCTVMIGSGLRVPRMRDVFCRNLIGDRGDGVERIPPTISNRRRNEANRPIRQHRRRQEEVQDDDVESTEHAHMEEDVPQPPQMEQAADDIHDASAHADEFDDPCDIDDLDQQTGFPGGPMDRGSLKVITHGLKLKKFAEVPLPDLLDHWIQESGLMHLSSGYLTMADAGLISVFVEIWHKETNSFHLPFGEMTITLDDVATLLHISPHGKFFDAPVNMNTNNAARAAHEYLSATWEEACAEISYNKFGCTIFADKTHTRVEVKYITLFIDLYRCRDYSWASAALVFLYDNLRDGAVHDTRQCWIYEHFPRICKRGDRGAVPTHLPRTCRWTAKHVVEGGLLAYRQRLDALLLEDIVFTPYCDE